MANSTIYYMKKYVWKSKYIRGVIYGTNKKRKRDTGAMEKWRTL
jgi:hypothetical protein